MHKFLLNSANKLKTLNLQNSITEKIIKNGINFTSIHTVPNSNAKKQNKKVSTNAIVNFNEMVTTRRLQAQKSILVQVNSEKSFPELENYCSQYGTIVGAHHYSLNNNHFILVEYSKELEAKQAIDQSTFSDDAGAGASVQSPFLWFRAAQKGDVAKNYKVSDNLMTTDGCRPINYDEINDIMINANNVADQMLILYRSTALNDLGIRLRFLAARQIEESISGIFPKAQACIFGSSVNGYGKLGCDLDMILQLNSTESKIEPNKRLVFHLKKTMTNARSQIQRNLENLSDTMHLFLPGVCHVRKILQARVPIIRYHHEHLDLEVDLSMNNMSGFYMSELLYMFTQIDERVSPVVFSIRRWAQTCQITNSSPGYWMSNFSLTCLVIFYLQQLDKPVLPSVNSLVEQARLQDKRISDDEELQCSFLRDLHSLRFTKENNDSIDDLLIGFFEFYSKIDFYERAISLNDAKLHVKPGQAALYIINPLEPSLNISKNMNFQECERFRIEVRNAAWILGSVNKSENNEMWGLLSLFRSQQQQVIKPSMFFKSRMIEVKGLWDGVVSEEGKVNNKINIKFKNDDVKNKVAKIQKQLRSDVNVLKSRGRKR